MISSTLRAAAGAFVLAVAAAFVTGAAADVTIKDASGRDVTISDTSRIVSIGGDITEILYALKADGKVIAVDSTSQFPAEAAKTKKVVGYMRALSAEGVLSTNPTLIIASPDSGPAEVVKLLKSSSVPYVEVPDDKSAEGVAEKIRFVASVIGDEAAGDALASKVEGDFAALAKDRAKITKPVRAIFVLSVTNGRAMIAGSKTSADAILKLAGAENAAGDVPGYKPLVDEAAMELAPDAIVTMKHGGNSMPSDSILSVKGLKMTPAGKNDRIIEMDGLYLLGFGPRSASAARDLMKALYPKLPERRAGIDE